MRAADPRQRDRCGVTFALPLDASTGRASVIGAFNDWTPGVGAARGTRIRPGNRERSRSGQPEPTALSLSAATPAPPAATPAPRPATARRLVRTRRSEEHTSELQSRGHLVCRLPLEKKKKNVIGEKRTRKWQDKTSIERHRRLR